MAVYCIKCHRVLIVSALNPDEYERCVCGWEM